MKIILDENDSAAVANIASSGTKGYEVLKKIFQEQMTDLTSVMNIDPKGNVGLQTCARQLAFDIIADIAEAIFPTEADKIKAARVPGRVGDGDKPISQWR